MNILVIGHSPSSKPYCPRKGNPTINRLNKWLDECNIKHFSFMNASADHVDSLKLSKNRKSYIEQVSRKYNKVLGLGNEVNKILKKLDVEHYELPHPSPRNRKFNDKSFEPKLIKNLKKYLQIDRTMV